MNGATFDASKHVKCQGCRGEGKVTLNFGAMGDHDGFSTTCSKCQGKGYTNKPVVTRDGCVMLKDRGAAFLLPEPKPGTVQHGEQRDTLRRIAREYQEAGGRAYTRGEDDVAAKMRDASKELLALADRLPAIPIETLTRGA